jgi:hypothetical protein
MLCNAVAKNKQSALQVPCAYLEYLGISQPRLNCINPLGYTVHTIGHLKRFVIAKLRTVPAILRLIIRMHCFYFRCKSFVFVLTFRLITLCHSRLSYYLTCPKLGYIHL